MLIDLQKLRRRRVITGMIVAALGVSLTGCNTEPPAVFEENLVFAYKVAKETDQPLDKLVQQSHDAVTDFFGTPDQPKLPEAIKDNEDLTKLVSLERLQRAAGPANPDANTGLYRLAQCHTCHGVTGEGRGPLAYSIEPYPRDYRAGVFKFKTTPRGSKPTRSDIARLIKHGIPGTPMNANPKMSDDDIEALVDYVIYLSWRGEVERLLLQDAAEVDFENDGLYDKKQANVPSEDEPEKTKFAVQAELAGEHVVSVGEAWLEADEKVLEVKVPEDQPVVRAGANLNDPALAASIAHGKEVFLGAVAACSKCHGNDGKGDGQTTDYDEWTKEWTLRANIQPTDVKAQVPLIARGALPPKVIRPRNFHEGVFRGGKEPEDLYRRIILGVDGTPMPAATMKSGSVEVGLTEKDVWDLVNYIKSLAPVNQPEAQPDATAKPVAKN